MRVGAAEAHLEGEKALEIVTHHQFVGHSHAAVQLDSLLTNETGRVANHYLRRGQDGRTPRVLLSLAPGCREVTIDRACSRCISISAIRCWRA